MNVWRAGFAVVAAIVMLLGLANVAIHHSPIWTPLVASCGIALALLLFERGRYAGASNRIDPHALPTGEVFFDPTTGAKTYVYHNATTGLREYR